MEQVPFKGACSKYGIPTVFYVYFCRVCVFCEDDMFSTGKYKHTPLRVQAQNINQIDTYSHSFHVFIIPVFSEAGKTTGSGLAGIHFATAVDVHGELFGAGQKGAPARQLLRFYHKHFVNENIYSYAIIVIGDLLSGVRIGFTCRVAFLQLPLPCLQLSFPLTKLSVSQNAATSVLLLLDGTPSLL